MAICKQLQVVAESLSCRRSPRRPRRVTDAAEFAHRAARRRRRETLGRLVRAGLA